jgi:hypothetical protein
VRGGSTVTLTFHMKNDIKANCGVARNSRNVTIAVNTSHAQIYARRRPMTSVAPIGQSRWPARAESDRIPHNFVNPLSEDTFCR